MFEQDSCKFHREFTLNNEIPEERQVGRDADTEGGRLYFKHEEANANDAPAETRLSQYFRLLETKEQPRQENGEITLFLLPPCRDCALDVFKKPEVKPSFVCAVTGRPARYRDPVTGLPYSTPFTFKIIRDKYHKYLKTIKDNPEVVEYMKQFE
ncbi:YL1 nuclear protein [Oesophagostomum dentatum]|uniref:YL1 nuclear protein n=1 Tax=Oesophagostomum dentatum TaxID=61180 RepID=A0A0B1TLY8_OESDE|nr:YL1 nuclear protein [Oesophagostomum dentatum]